MTSETNAADIEWYQAQQHVAQIDMTDMGLSTLSDMVLAQHIDIAPDFQRRDRWSNKQRSLLIDSFLRNIPVPPIYLAEDRNNMGEYAVIDGKQRTTAITLFFNDELELTNLTNNPFNGKKFSQLPKKVQSSLRLKTIRIISIQHGTSEEIAHEVFKRLNTAGTQLTAQELRNVAFRGTLNDCLIELAKNQIFVRQFGFSNQSKAMQKMDDVQYVLRFLSLKDNWRNFSGNLQKTMDDYMAEFSNPSSNWIQDTKRQFINTLDTVYSIWGESTFQRPQREQALAGVYDAQMLAIASFDDDDRQKLIESRNEIVAEWIELFNNEDFYKAVTNGTNAKGRLIYRVSTLEDLLRSYI